MSRSTSAAPAPQARNSRRSAPLPLVAGVLMIVTVALAGAWLYTRSRVVEPTPIITRREAHPTRQLRTDLMSFRRTPTLIAADLEAQQISEATTAMMNTLADTVGPSSCVQVTAGFDPASPVLTAKAPTTPLVPASNQKLLTAFTALIVLGPDYVYTTEVWGPAPVAGTVPGDVYLVGGGDPLLATDDFVDAQHFASFNRTSLDALADGLVAAGVSKIDGAVVGDGQRYDDEFRVESWGDGIGSSEAGPYDALLVNDAAISPGEYALEPNRAAAVQFKRLLDWRGVTSAAADNFARPNDPALVKLASVTSHPMSDVLAEMLQSSDNNTAEMVLKEIGFVAKGQGTRQAGLDTVWSTLSEAGIPLEGVELADGSGLSRNNRATCATLNALFRNQVGTQLLPLLPLAGRTGTLYDQLVSTPAAGALRAKTGTLRNVKALSGEMPDRIGDPIVFSLVLNEPAANEPTVYEPAWDALANVIADYPPAITVDPEPFEPLTTD